MNLRFFALIFWVAVIAILAYIYFFQPEVFHRIFEYAGGGSPYVNTPTGN